MMIACIITVAELKIYYILWKMLMKNFNLIFIYTSDETIFIIYKSNKRYNNNKKWDDNNKIWNYATEENNKS